MAPNQAVTEKSNPASLSSQNSDLEHLKMTVSKLADPAPLAMGAFATTLLTFSLSLMGLRGVSVEAIHVGNLCFVAGIGLFVSGQWDMVRGNTFSYTVLTAFGLFYAGYGATLIPFFGVVDAYGGLTADYYNAFGLYILIWAVFNLFFLVASVRFNIVYILIFTTVELCLVFDASSCMTKADGNSAASTVLKTMSGAFAFIAGLLGYYAHAHYLCEDALPFRIPMGDTSRFFRTR